MSKGKLIISAITLLTAAILFYNTVQQIETPSQSSLTPQQQENLKCVARNTMLSRGQDWVDKKIPYSQTKTYDGYRTDCSGFVSMMWQLAKPGLTTSTMHTASHNITKDQLQAGDALNCQGQHILLFVQWTNSSKTHYIAMEESGSYGSAVKRDTIYPHWSSKADCYHPIRFNSVC